VFVDEGFGNGNLARRLGLGLGLICVCHIKNPNAHKKKRVRETETIAERMITLNARTLFSRGSKSQLRELPNNTKTNKKI